MSGLNLQNSTGNLYLKSVNNIFLKKRIGKNREARVEKEDLKEVDKLTKQIEALEKNPDHDKAKAADLKTQRHEIMKKESHEILIVKR